ncbi:MAG: gliding motility protein GldL [Bacteroidales bacterium]|nr:gliding motility protein GldL [Bacteroidales bacterium]MDE6439931.1 gliding motility protein GldL [Bacteroidales bacterium]
MGIAKIVESKGYKKFMAYLYGWGASIVIVGALFKINHYPGANLMLIVGMSIEAIIFFFSVFEPPHKELDWTKVYPELKEDAEPVAESAAKRGGGGASNPLAAKIDEMFEQANITPEIFDNLREGLTKLTQTTTAINNVTNVVNANDQYAGELQKMTDQLVKLNDFYANQMQVSTKQMEDTRKLQDNMNQIMENLNESLDDAKKYRTEINELSQKVAALNDMYGKMLGALSMTVNNK